MSRTVPAAILQTIEAHRHFVLTTHTRPDADALGSVLALHLGLLKLRKHSQVIHREGVPEICRFLPASGDVRASVETVREEPIVGIVLDSDVPPRAAMDAEEFHSFRLRILIDHHATTPATDSLAWVVPKASATGELVQDLLQALSVEIDSDIATNLYAAITTDTGWFRFSNTTSEALRACATLVESGADVREVAKHLFEERSYAATKLMGRALGSLEVACEGRLVWANLTRKDFGDCQATDEETEGIVNHVKGVRGSEVAVLFREDAQGKIRVSLRSESQVDVSEISHRFGGGGHAAAAGCTLALSLLESQETILGAVRERIEALEGAPGVTSEKR